jgi:hypothetical protein
MSSYDTTKKVLDFVCPMPYYRFIKPTTKEPFMSNYDFSDTDFETEIWFDTYENIEFDEEDFDESMIDYYAESSLFGWE